MNSQSCPTLSVPGSRTCSTALKAVIMIGVTLVCYAFIISSEEFIRHMACPSVRSRFPQKDPTSLKKYWREAVDKAHTALHLVNLSIQTATEINMDEAEPQVNNSKGLSASSFPREHTKPHHIRFDSLDEVYTIPISPHTKQSRLFEAMLSMV